MINPVYRQQVQLLLQVLTQVADEKIFALKGGTAINLFYRDLPRLSVDIDLCYLPVVNREKDLQAIAEGLLRIKDSLASLSPIIESDLIAQGDGTQSKLLCRQGSVQVKIEVNTVMRGHLQAPSTLPLSERAQEEFGLFSANQVLSAAEIYGGKLCAALDRQHPRDLFDVAILFEQEGITSSIKCGFVVSLLSHNRPMHELLQPTITDNRTTFENQFAGMSLKAFNYDDYEMARKKLVKELHLKLTDRDRKFLVSFKEGNPDWTLFDWSGLETMPAIQWKLKNLTQLIRTNPRKHSDQLSALERCL